VPHTEIDLHFTDLLRHNHVLHAEALEGGGWTLLALVEGRTFTKRCSHWQAVERSLMWLRHHAHDEPFDPGWTDPLAATNSHGFEKFPILSRH